MELAWHTAKMTAYAPAKGRDFVRLKDITIANDDTPKLVRKGDWRRQLAMMTGWVDGRKG